MPERAPHFCAFPGCGQLTRTARCRQHALEAEQARPDYAPRRWHRTARWRLLRQAVLREAAYTCAICHMVGSRLQIDHIVPHGGDPQRFWDRANLQPLCPACHTKKTRSLGRRIGRNP